MNKKYKILLVDDDNLLRELYIRKIKELGHEIETLPYAEEDFVQKVLEIKPDLIALDVLMPKLDGFEALKLLKADPRTKDIPVIFETNFSEVKAIKKGISLGAVDYIVIASLTFSELIKSYFDYLNDPHKYIKHYPTFLEASKPLITKNKKFKIVLFSVILMGILFLYFLFSIFILPNVEIPNSDEEKFLVSLKCPEEYNSPEEYIQSIAIFMDYYKKKYPNITEKDLIQIRGGWFISHQCGGWSELNNNAPELINPKDTEPTSNLPDQYFISDKIITRGMISLQI